MVVIFMTDNIEMKSRKERQDMKQIENYRGQ